MKTFLMLIVCLLPRVAAAQYTDGYVKNFHMAITALQSNISDCSSLGGRSLVLALKYVTRPAEVRDVVGGFDRQRELLDLTSKEASRLMFGLWEVYSPEIKSRHFGPSRATKAQLKKLTLELIEYLSTSYKSTVAILGPAAKNAAKTPASKKRAQGLFNEAGEGMKRLANTKQLVEKEL